MRLLLISNSTNAGEKYLEYPKNNIKDFLAKSNVKKVMFVPYAAVTFSYDAYQAKVAERLAEIGIEVDSVHRYENPREAIMNAEAVVVGGGNTFHLVKNMQDKGLYEVITEKVKAGTPYIGWSAGSNVSCPTLCTTNDMPIVEPLSFKCLNLIPFQINPHYLDAHPDGHAGETREQRIEEFLAANKGTRVAGLREGCMFVVEDDSITLIGSRPLRVFKYGEEPKEYTSNDDINFLLK
ncbi:MAG: dipeptidase PepE [Rikenellaceae bacterium]